MTDLDDKLMQDHEYDGIRELDNDLPQWWVWLFYLTIIWSVVYMFYYHVADIGYLSSDEYRREVDPNYVRPVTDPKILGLIDEYHSPYADPDYFSGKKGRSLDKVAVVFVEEKREADTATYVLLTDDGSLTAGKSIFVGKCASCHGQLGEGGIGPNLTDAYWLHGAGMNNIAKTVKYGVPTKGMISWRYELKPEQILQVASFITTLQGTNPPNAKPPQGELVTQ